MPGGVIMSQAVSHTVPITYATGVRGTLSTGGWKALFRVGVVHFAVLVALLVATSKGLLMLVELLRPAADPDWFVLAMVGRTVAIYVMVTANALAVLGYWAGFRGRSPRKWFLVYVPTQLALMLLEFATSVVLVAASPHQVSPTSSVGVSVATVFVLPLAYVVLNLPLFLLVFPRIRRGCFAA